MRVLALAHTIWTERWMNRQQLLSRVGKHTTVLYSNAAWYTWNRQDPRWQASPLIGRFDSMDNVTVEQVPRLLLRSPRFATLDRWVVRAQARRWTRWLKAHGEGPLLMHLFHPEFEVYIDEVRPDAVVYHPYDLYEHMPGWTSWLHEFEDRVLRRADRVITSSEVTARRLTERSGAEVTVIPNGADIQLFGAARRADAPCPGDLAQIPMPRIGYIGSLQPTVDLLLLANLARRHPEWHIVFVGDRSPSVDEATAEGLRQCELLENVHFLGMKSREAVPGYMLNMDVNILCWRVGEGLWADAAYPLKLQEYLACGKPVVTSDIAAVQPFADVLRIAHDVDDWDLAISEAVSGRGPGDSAARIAVAERNSWDDRAVRLLACLDQLSTEKAGQVAHARC